VILVTIGTLPFPRLIQAMDDYAATSDRPVMLQCAGSPVDVQHAQWQDYLPDHERWIAEAEVVVLHAGVGTIHKVIDAKKPFVIVPRRGHLGEHFDDHQWVMTQKVGALLPGVVVDDIAELPAAIERCPQRLAEAGYLSTRPALVDALRGCVEGLMGIAPPAP